MRAQPVLTRAWSPATAPRLHRLTHVQAVGGVSQRWQTGGIGTSYAPSSLYSGLLGSRQSPCRAYSSSSSGGSTSHSEPASSVPLLLRIGKAILRAAAALVAAALLTVAALPAVLSTQAGLQKAVQLANYFTPAQVCVGQVQLPRHLNPNPKTVTFLLAASSISAGSHMVAKWPPSMHASAAACSAAQTNDRLFSEGSFQSCR